LTLYRETEMTFDEVMSELRSLESAENRAGMARFGINTDHALGVSVTNLRALAKRNSTLRLAAIKTAREILAQGDGKGRWVASDALRELGAS